MTGPAIMSPCDPPPSQPLVYVRGFAERLSVGADHQSEGIGEGARNWMERGGWFWVEWGEGLVEAICVYKMDVWVFGDQCSSPSSHYRLLRHLGFLTSKAAGIRINILIKALKHNWCSMCDGGLTVRLSLRSCMINVLSL